MTNSRIGLDPASPRSHWTVRIDGSEVEGLTVRRPSEITEEQWDTVRATAASVLARCPAPDASSGSITGLALGKVQSGKTLSYTTLIALAIDNGYRIIVVLAGTKNPLLGQNFDRLCADLNVGHNAQLIPFKNPVPEETSVVQNVIQGSGHALIAVLKNRKRIDDVRKLLTAPELRTAPTLIIDDEGDEASLNTQFRKGRRSAVYESILKMRSTLRLHAYIAYTATPQANLLISNIDGLSPDFGVLIEPGSGYCGGSVFFGKDRDKYVRVVPFSETGEKDAGNITAGVKRAIATFLTGGAIRHLREPAGWHSMLIHTSNLRVDHEALQNNVQGLIAHWKDILRLPNTDPAKADLLILFREAYDDLARTVTNLPAWDIVVHQLNEEVRLEIWMVNSLPTGRDPIGTPFRLKNNILVGGNMLGRGVTIRDLAVTYITRRAQQETNADTMEQRARWFGYKQRYLDICRLFLTTQLRDDYTELLRSEDDFWDALSRNQRQGLSIKQWPRMIALNPNLGIHPTRQSVASYRQFRGRGWDIQSTMIVDPILAGQNVAAVRKFFADNRAVNRDFCGPHHSIVSSCPTDKIISDLLAVVQTPGTDWEPEYTTEFLSRLFLGGKLPAVDVLLMSAGETRTRAHAVDSRKNEIPDQVENLMQGRNPPAPAPVVYPGDREIHNNRVQLQVHLVKLRGADLVTTAFALYVPQEPQFDLWYVVRADLGRPATP